MTSSAFPGIGRIALTLPRFGVIPPYPRLGGGCSGGVVDIVLLSLGGAEARNVDDLQLETVRIEEEHRVMPRDVRVFLRLALQLDVLGAQPVGALVDDAARRGLEGKVVQSDAVAVVRRDLRLHLAQPDGRARAADVPDRLAALALDLAHPVEAERAEQPGVERQAAPDRRDDEVDVM